MTTIRIVVWSGSIVLTVGMSGAWQPVSAEIISIDEFIGDKSEGFETQTPFEFQRSYDVFGGQGVVQQIGEGQGLLIATKWIFYTTVFPHSGDFFMGGAGVDAEWVFDTPVKRFGGYFTTNSDVQHGVANFFDDAGNMIGQMDVTAPLGNAWTWNGWETDGAGIKSVQILANFRFGGNIMHDDMQYTAIPDCAWDLDGDDNVGTGDLIVLLGSWGDPYGTADLIELLGAWGPCPK